MQVLIKAAVSLIVIMTAGWIGKKIPSMAGLIAVMPLTGVLVLLWVYTDQAGNPAVMREYAKGALWGLLPSILFFLVAFLCFKKGLSLGIVLGSSFAVWLCGALVHQWLLR